jgi:hypothetical protein
MQVCYDVDVYPGCDLTNIVGFSHFQVAAFTVVAWEYLITFNEELTWIWRCVYSVTQQVDNLLITLIANVF